MEAAGAARQRLLELLTTAGGQITANVSLQQLEGR